MFNYFSLKTNSTNLSNENVILLKINQIEYYLIPTCFLIGLIGNVLGALCLLSNKKMRKHTPLFILSIIGITDSILLASQLQRWLAINFDQNTFLITSSLCKIYFMFIRCSILISACLTFILVIIRFISLYMGTYNLSIYSNIGQIFSRLCVTYVIALAVSLSWHELWTSGLKKGDIPVFEEEYDDISFDTKTTTNQPDLLLNDDLTCSKNVASFEIIDMLNILYFIILSSLYLFLLLIPAFLFIKIKNLDKYFPCCYNEFDLSNSNSYNDVIISPKIIRNEITRGNLNKKSLSLPNFKETHKKNERKTFSSHEICEIDLSTNETDQSDEIEKNFQNKNVRTALKLKHKKKPRKFSIYICVISFLTALFCLPYTYYDYVYYKDALVHDLNINYQTNSSNIQFNSIFLNTSLKRLPLLLINIPHAIKFYLLFIFYSKFRHQMSKFLKIRLYFNKKMIKFQLKSKNFQLINKRETRINSFELNNIETNTVDNNNNKNNQSISNENNEFSKFVFMHHFNLILPCFNRTTTSQTMPNKLKKNIFVKNVLLNYNKKNSSLNFKLINKNNIKDENKKVNWHDNYSDTSSIIGFNFFTNKSNSNQTNYKYLNNNNNNNKNSINYKTTGVKLNQSFNLNKKNKNLDMFEFESNIPSNYNDTVISN